MTLPNLRPLGFGETLDRAFTLYRRNFLLFVGTSLLTLAGVFAGGMVVGIATALVVPFVPGVLGFAVMAILVLGLVALAMVPAGAITRQAAQTYTGHPTSLGDGLGVGGRAALRLMGAGIIAMVSLGVMMVILWLVMYTLISFAGGIGNPALMVVTAAAAGIGIMVAFCLLMAIYFAVVPAVVLEGKGPMEAVSRSQELAEGSVPRIAGIMGVALLITYLPIMAVLWMSGGFAQVANPDPAAPSFTSMAMQQLLSMGVNVLVTPFLLSVMVVLYYDRRVRTEALDVQILTERLGLAGA